MFLAQISSLLPLNQKLGPKIIGIKIGTCQKVETLYIGNRILVHCLYIDKSADHVRINNNNIKVNIFFLICPAAYNLYITLL